MATCRTLGHNHYTGYKMKWQPIWVTFGPSIPPSKVELALNQTRNLQADLADIYVKLLRVGGKFVVQGLFVKLLVTLTVIYPYSLEKMPLTPFVQKGRLF